MSATVTHDEKVAADQAAMDEARAAAATDPEPEPLTWADVTAGDVIEVFVFDRQHGWEWESREVLGIDRGAGEDADPVLIVKLRDPDEDRDYEIDGIKDTNHALRWPEVPVEEDPDGQQRIGGPGTEPTFSTDAGGSPPHEAELSIKAKKIEWPTDLRRGSQVLLLVWAYVDEVRVAASSKTFVAEIGQQMVVEHPTLRPLEVMDSLRALESRPRRDRALIDQAAKLAAELVDAAGGIVELDLAVAMRERLYDRFSIDDDPVEATHGTPDHEEPEDDRSLSDIVQDEVDSIDAAEEEAAALTAAGATEGGE